MGRPSPCRGVHRHLVYTNDCTDGTVEMLKGWRNSASPSTAKRHPGGAETAALRLNHAQKEPLVAASDWLLVFDADEFLCINHPSGTLEGLLDDTVARRQWRRHHLAHLRLGRVLDWSRASP
jgi:hypothetical protein